MNDSPEKIVQIVREILAAYAANPKHWNAEDTLQDIDMIVNQKKIEVVFDE